MKLCRAHMECWDVHVKFLFKFFSNFEIYYLDKEIICSADQTCISAYFVTSYHVVTLKHLGGNLQTTRWYLSRLKKIVKHTNELCLTSLNLFSKESHTMKVERKSGLLIES
jgi:hypothetical protein